MPTEETDFLAQYHAARAAQQACFEKHLAAGVIFLSPDGILIDDSVVIAPGATILPGTILRGATTVGAGSVIGPNSLLENAAVGENVSFNASQGYACTIQSGAAIGPFSHIRPDSVIGENVHLGDFVEIKNSTIGAGTSVSHLTYVGDSDVG
ncbi:MAG: UDP-N-acetylglucosamine diphosphorylase, partial [Ruthenibacterium sp.]